MPQTNPGSTRRVFLRQAGAGALFGVFTSLPAHLARAMMAGALAAPVNDRIHLGCIGVGSQGKANMGPHLKDVVAVCDVDRNHLAQARARVGKATRKACAAYSDYRKLLDSKDVDAVIIATPDHWHALQTIQAGQAGKDVYCETPLSLTVVEGRAMVRAACQYRRIVQTGSQQRSAANFRRACELVRNGRLGKVHTVRVGLPGVNFKGPAVRDSAPPLQLDYDFWLGPAPKRPYNSKRVHDNFRFFWDYSGGQLTNWGAHHLDIAQWGLGTDDSGPVGIEGTGRSNKDHWFEVPESFEVVYQYASGVKMICGQAQKGGITFEGDKGSIQVNRGQLASTPADLIREKLGEGDLHLDVSKDHFANWLACIKSRKLPICDVEIGHRSATVCHLGNIAIRTGRKIRWDPARERIVGDAEAAKMLSRPYRAPWRLPVVSPCATFKVTGPRRVEDATQGGTKKVTLSIKRDDGFDQDVELRPAGILPEGITVKPATIKNGEDKTDLKVDVSMTAAAGEHEIKLDAIPSKDKDHPGKVSFKIKVKAAK